MDHTRPLLHFSAFFKQRKLIREIGYFVLLNEIMQTIYTQC